MKHIFFIALFLAPFLLYIVLVGFQKRDPSNAFANELFSVDHELESRSISFENPTGEKGKGGMAASNLGIGRKGHPAEVIKPGQTVTLCNIKGPGIIRHIWVTTLREPENLLGMVVRAYWDGQEYPSIEAPVGCFMGFWHGMKDIQPYQSAVHSVNSKAGMNIWIPMPFSKKARITLTNEGKKENILFYQIDYTIGDELKEPFGRLHTLYRRENPTTPKQDFEILPKRTGQGRYLGCVLGIRTLEQLWFGEGEFKVYLDGDNKFPTICGTGLEDYVLQSWGLQRTPHLYAGTIMHDPQPEENYNRPGMYAVYRWHIKDPIYWKKDIRVTIQQLGWSPTTLVERPDDYTSTTFWYEPIPSSKLPQMPDYKARGADYKIGAATQ